MNGRRRAGSRWRAWVATIAIAAALAIAAVACDRNVPLGAAPVSDAAVDDGGDAGETD